MKNCNQYGGVVLNILLVIMLSIIAVLIYLLAGGPVPKLTRTVGVNSPVATTTDDAHILVQPAGVFTDGLDNPDFSEEYPLDETGTGVAARTIFDRDINGDGIRDIITRTRNENGTAHHYYQYKIELNNGGEFVDITPDEFRTVEGAECALAKIQFSFHPEFRAVKITRPWNVSWTTPTTATKIVYAMENQKLVPIERTEMKSVCDVTDLF